MNSVQIWDSYMSEELKCLGVSLDEAGLRENLWNLGEKITTRERRDWQNNSVEQEGDRGKIVVANFDSAHPFQGLCFRGSRKGVGCGMRQKL